LLNDEKDDQMAENGRPLETVKSELEDVQARLGRLYESLETGKLSLDDLAPRIQSLRQLQERLQTTRLGLERDVADHKVELGDERTIRAHMQDFRRLLTESPIPEQKTFIRSFVKEVKVTGKEVLLTYTMPLAPEGKREEVA
ncbi:MAG: recombinase family protein, partial [Dehalococcoidia bacterium]|nr:recombinase family protein [Dehalococcoidia bacterium]